MSKHLLALGAATLMSLGSLQAPAMSEHEQEVAAWRTGRIERLTAPDGWLSLVGLHWVPVGTAQTVGNGDGVDIDLGVGPQELGRIEWAGGMPWFVAAEDAAATVADAPASRVELLPELANAPVVIRFGTASLQMLQRGEKFALRIKDSEAPTRLKFSGIPHFDVDPSWRIDARFERYPEPRTIEVATVVGTLEAYPNPGRIVFERDGKTHRIEALVEEGTDQYFLIIADRSSGKEGFFWLERILQIDPSAVVILITAYGDVEMAVQAIKGGATDFVLKPWDNDKLLASLSSALKLKTSIATAIQRWQRHGGGTAALLPGEQ